MVGSIIATVGEGEKGGGGEGGKEDSCVLLTEWRCKLKSAWQDRRTWDGHASSPKRRRDERLRGETLVRADAETVSPPRFRLHG